MYCTTLVHSTKVLTGRQRTRCVASQIVNVDAAIENGAAQHCFLGVHLTNDFHISAAPMWVADGFTDEESIEFHAVGSLLVLLRARRAGPVWRFFTNYRSRSPIIHSTPLWAERDGASVLLHHGHRDYTKVKTFSFFLLMFPIAPMARCRGCPGSKRCV